MCSLGGTSALSLVVRSSLTVALALGCSLAPLHGATLQRLTLEQIIAKSTAIVRGKVIGSFAASRGPIIYTHYSILVSEQFKGEPQSTVDLSIPGGTANNFRQTFPGAPQFQAGEEYVFFLWTGPSGLTQIMGLTQGLFKLSETDSTDPQVTRAASAELMLDPKTGRPVKDQTLVMSLTALRSLIGSTLKRGAAL